MSKNILLITGSAPCVLDDISVFITSYPQEHDFMAIGLSAVDKYAWPFKYMATYHPVQIPEIKVCRGSIGGNTDYIVISHERKEGVDIIEPFIPPTGSSTHLGALAAIRLGYKKIILCGCPLDLDKYKIFRKGWEAKIKQTRDFVRSMSGWTKEFLGEPTGDWLNG